MSPLIPLPAAFTNLRNAIDLYGGDAKTLFEKAHGNLAQPVPISPETLGEFNARNQGQLAAAFSQLSTAATMESAQRGREGYDAVVTLMATISTTATAICDQLKVLIPAGSPVPTTTKLPETLDIIRTLTAALEALAHISPISVWQKASTPDGTTG